MAYVSPGHRCECQLHVEPGLGGRLHEWYIVLTSKSFAILSLHLALAAAAIGLVACVDQEGGRCGMWSATKVAKFKLVIQLSDQQLATQQLLLQHQQLQLPLLKAAFNQIYFMFIAGKLNLTY